MDISDVVMAAKAIGTKASAFKHIAIAEITICSKSDSLTG